jgi:hypothetical protein
MARLFTAFVGAAGGFMLFAQDALAAHREGPVAPTTSSGIAWTTIGIWSAIGLGIVLVAAWLAFEGRRHQWHPPHRPVHN